MASSSPPHPQKTHSLLSLDTAAMSIIGLGLEKATKPLLISWVVFLAGFLMVAAVIHVLSALPPFQFSKNE